MSKFFRKHDYVVTCNVKTYDDVLNKNGTARKDEITSVLDSYLQKAKLAETKNTRAHFFIYYSGTVV